jgi:hypothetical protein
MTKVKVMTREELELLSAEICKKFDDYMNEMIGSIPSGYMDKKYHVPLKAQFWDAITAFAEERAQQYLQITMVNFPEIEISTGNKKNEH